VHRDCCDAGVLHRDISANNIMFYSPSKEPKQVLRNGMLIDFDYAAFLTDSESDSDGQFSLGNRTVCLFITHL
jgi:serine/threonine protein kinase